MRREARFRPFASRGRLAIVAILLTFIVFSTLTVVSSIRSTNRSKNRSTVIEVAARQRTLAERYLADILLVQRGYQADPASVAAVLTESAHVLLDGGTAPAVNGNDDDVHVPPAIGADLRAQIVQEQRLVTDLTREGRAVLTGRAVPAPLTGHEQITARDPVERLRILEALTSDVAFNAAGSIAAADRRNVNSQLRMQVGLGVAGLLLALFLAWALIRVTRRQTGHFRSLISSSSELVFVLGPDGCRYAGHTVVSLLGCPEEDLLGPGIESYVHEDDREAVRAAAEQGEPARLVFRVRNAAGVWRYLDADLSDLRHNRHLQGVVFNARDITERVELERQLTEQARRDTFSGQLVEALEMADDEASAYEVTERAMVEIDPGTPMELLVSDSSRAHLKPAASSPTAGAPSCPVESPFACVAVRRGNPVVFEDSDALNACPNLRDRSSGACSAVCVPISFMGRALGVLHTTGPAGRPLSREKVEQLTTLATQAGTRVGTVRAFEKTQLQAATDQLTGLDNRRTIERHLRRFAAEQRPYALALADLDHFKQLNDKHGHDAGDRALRLFAQVSLDAVRENDLVGRWGGEEFVFVFPGLDQSQAATVLERLRTRLSSSHTGQHPRFTASFGVTDSSHAETIQELVQIADAALYAAKNEGRDQIRTDGGLTRVGSDGSGTSVLPDHLWPRTAAGRTRRAVFQSASRASATSPVSGVDGQVAAAGEVGVVAGALDVGGAGMASASAARCWSSAVTVSAASTAERGEAGPEQLARGLVQAGAGDGSADRPGVLDAVALAEVVGPVSAAAAVVRTVIRCRTRRQ